MDLDQETTTIRLSWGKLIDQYLAGLRGLKAKIEHHFAVLIFTCTCLINEAEYINRDESVTSLQIWNRQKKNDRFYEWFYTCSKQSTSNFTQYDIRMDSVMRKTEGGTFAKEKRRIHSEVSSRMSPGPAEYKIKLIAESPSFAIPKSPRQITVNSARVPGPGQYDPHFEAVQQSNPRSVYH